jgi:predicted NAD/FAD-dependent oxidoreductase
MSVNEGEGVRELCDVQRRGLLVAQRWLSSSDRSTNRIPADKVLVPYPTPQTSRLSTYKQSERRRHTRLEQLVYQYTRPVYHRHIQRTPVLVEREVEQVIVEGEIVVRRL